MNERSPEEDLRWLGGLLHLGGAAITGILVLLMMQALFAPIDREIARCEAALAEVEGELNASPKVASEHRQVRDELVRLRTQKAVLRQRITDGPREDEFLRQVSLAADAAQLQLREYRPGGAQHQGSYGSMTIHLDGEGTYTSICQFLDALSNSPRMSKVQRLQIASSNQSLMYPVSLAVEIFFASGAPTSATEKPHGRRSS